MATHYDLFLWGPRHDDYESLYFATNHNQNNQVWCNYKSETWFYCLGIYVNVFSSYTCECTDFRFANVYHLGSNQRAHWSVIHFFQCYWSWCILVHWRATHVDAMSSLWYSAGVVCSWTRKQTYIQAQGGKETSDLISALLNDIEFLLDVWHCGVENLYSSIHRESCRLLYRTKDNIRNSYGRVSDDNAPNISIPSVAKGPCL